MTGRLRNMGDLLLPHLLSGQVTLNNLPEEIAA